MVEQTENIVGMRKKIKAQAEHVRRLEQRIRELKQPEQSGWVSVAERVPSEEVREVLVLMDDGSCEIAWASYWHGARNDFACWTFRDPDEDRTLTHWMPLPAPPAQGTPQ